jgi:AraC family transcriptional regulator
MAGKISNGQLPIIDQSLDYIDRHLAEKITLEAIAKHCHISVFYFCSQFAQIMHVSPYQYILQQRVQKAQQLLETTTLPLCEIALLCGFSSQSQMCQHFRKSAKLTPKSYRKLAS